MYTLFPTKKATKNSIPATAPERETAFVNAMRNAGQRLIPVTTPRTNGRWTYFYHRLNAHIFSYRKVTIAEEIKRADKRKYATAVRYGRWVIAIFAPK